MGSLLRIFSVILVLTGVACTPKSQEPEYVIGFTPAESASTVMTNGQEVADVITKKTGIKLKTYVASDYTALIEAMRGGKVQFGWLAPFQLVLAEKHAGAHVLLKTVRSGKTFFYSVIFVKKNSPFKTIKDLKGKNIAWVDPASSSGYIVPKASLLNDGYDPETFFNKQIFAGGHDTVILGVINGSVDAGATFSNDPQGKTAAWTMLNTIKAHEGDNLRVIYASKPIPNDAFATTDEFMKSHADIVKNVTDAILHIDSTPEGRKAMYDLYRIDAMTTATSEDFEPLRKAAAKLNVDVKKQK